MNPNKKDTYLQSLMFSETTKKIYIDLCFNFFIYF